MCSFRNQKNTIELIYDYKDNDVYRDSFNRLANLVFGIDFEEWYEKGCWDDRYICHSILDGNEVVANISVSKMDLILSGLKKKSIQIGTVMTHPEFRGRGLSRYLMNHVLDHYEQECELFFLFANNSVLDFYPKFNFIQVPESQFSADITGMRRKGGSLFKLNLSKKEDLEFIKKSVLSRKSVSQQFGIENNQGIFMFYALNLFKDHLFFSKTENAIIVYKQVDETLHLYDVVSEDNVNFTRLLSQIADENTKTVRFYFTPDQFMNNTKKELLNRTEDRLFVKSSSVLVNSGLRFPKIFHA
jgi:GNAT superfamily N-acetyltransferase